METQEMLNTPIGNTDKKKRISKTCESEDCKCRDCQN